MGSFSIWHWLIVLAVVVVLFGGGGKISRIMGDFGKGIKSFKKGIKEEIPSDDAEASARKISSEEDASEADVSAAKEANKDNAAKS